MTTYHLDATAAQFVEPLARAKVRVLDPALTWIRRELEAARRENQDAQFLATGKGAGYPRRL